MRRPLNGNGDFAAAVAAHVQLISDKAFLALAGLWARQLWVNVGQREQQAHPVVICWGVREVHRFCYGVTGQAESFVSLPEARRLRPLTTS